MNRFSKPSANPKNLERILSELVDDDIYSSVAVTFLAQERDLLDPSFSERAAMQRLRITLNRLTDLHAFPVAGDCLVVDEGKTPTPGWFGWRWKKLARG